MGVSVGTNVSMEAGDSVGITVGTKVGSLVRRSSPHWYEVPQESVHLS